MRAASEISIVPDCIQYVGASERGGRMNWLEMTFNNVYIIYLYIYISRGVEGRKEGR